MDWKRLLQLSKDDSLESLRRNQLAFRIAKEAILNFIANGEVSSDNEFENAYFVWNRQDKHYVLVAEETDGKIVIEFPNETEATIIRDGINDFKIDPILDNTMSLLRQCMVIVDGKAQVLEQTIAQNYLKQVRFGDTQYLEAEFKDFAKRFMDTVTEHPGRDLYNHLPLKFNYRGRLREYLNENGGNITNLHITNG